MSFEEIVYDSLRPIQSYFTKDEDMRILEKKRPKALKPRSKTSKSVDKLKHFDLILSDVSKNEREVAYL